VGTNQSNSSYNWNLNNLLFRVGTNQSNSSYNWTLNNLLFRVGTNQSNSSYNLTLKQSSPATRHEGAWWERRYSFYSFLTSAVDGVSGQRHASTALCPGERTPGTHCTGGWVGLRAGLDTEVRGKILCPCLGSNPDRPVVQSVVIHYTDWANNWTLNNLLFRVGTI
jgi:hypothetical protein